MMIQEDRSLRVNIQHMSNSTDWYLSVCSNHLLDYLLVVIRSHFHRVDSILDSQDVAHEKENVSNRCEGILGTLNGRSPKTLHQCSFRSWRLAVLPTVAATDGAFVVLHWIQVILGALRRITTSDSMQHTP